jgi:hypothetical protein
MLLISYDRGNGDITAPLLRSTAANVDRSLEKADPDFA